MRAHVRKGPPVQMSAWHQTLAATFPAGCLVAPFAERSYTSLLAKVEDHSTGVFLRLPPALEDQFPETASVPHVTLVYPGPVSPEGYETVRRIAAEEADMLLGETLKLGELRYFENEDGSRVAYVAVETSEAVRQGRARMHAKVQEAGVHIRSDYESWVPHATLAYLEPGEEYTGPVPRGSWVVREVEVWRGGVHVPVSEKTAATLILDAPSLDCTPEDLVKLYRPQFHALLGHQDTEEARKTFTEAGLWLFKVSGANDKVFACNYELPPALAIIDLQTDKDFREASRPAVEDVWGYPPSKAWTRKGCLQVRRAHLAKQRGESPYAGFVEFADREALAKAAWSVSGDTDLPLGPDQTWDAAAARQRLWEWGSDAEGNLVSERLRRVFFAVDEDELDLKRGYKLAFCDIIDGEPMAMPRALDAVASRLPQTSSLPAAVRTQIREEKLDAYRERMSKAGLPTKALKEAMVLKPFAGFIDFADCVAAQRSAGYGEDSARAICGKLQAEVEGARASATCKAAPGELEVGDIVEYNTDVGRGRGEVVSIHIEEPVPGPSQGFAFGEPEDPAARVRVWERTEEEDEVEWEATEDYVAAMFSQLTKLDAIDAKKSQSSARPKRTFTGKSTVKGQLLTKAEYYLYDEATSEEDSARAYYTGGTHWHCLDRLSRYADQTGSSHCHVFRLPDGSLAWTEFDGFHGHNFDSTFADVTDEDGAHVHLVRLPDGQVLLTREDGAHVHGLEVEFTVTDGAHRHALILPDGTRVESLTPGELLAGRRGESPFAEMISLSVSGENSLVVKLDQERVASRFAAAESGREATAKDASTANSADVDAGPPPGEVFVRLHKYDEGEERFVFGIVLEPDGVDSQGDTITAEVIRTAAHDFLANYGNIGLQHQAFVNGQVRILESYIAPCDMELAGVSIKAGTWLMAMRVLDDGLWDAVKNSALTGFSIGGFGVRVPVD
jgi:2'-5' RNA ligase